MDPEPFRFVYVRVLVLMLMLVACGGSDPTPISGASESSSAFSSSSSAGGGEAPRSAETFGGLPHLPRPLGTMTPRFRRAWHLTRASAEVSLPQPVEQVTVPVFRSWVRELMAPWLRARLETIDEVVVVLRGMRAGDPGEYLIGSALLGFLNDDTADQLAGVYVPSMPADAIDMAHPLRRLLNGEAERLRGGARSAYERCVGVTVGTPEVAAWRQRCLARGRALGTVEP